MNPVEVVQQYIQQNPSAAMAIATGNMPEGNMNRPMVQMPNGSLVERKFMAIIFNLKHVRVIEDSGTMTVHFFKSREFSKLPFQQWK